jgi:predicted transcriptional regulator of viral defense system
MSDNRSILTYLNNVESATLEELYNISDYSYYANWQKHFGQVMSRLVKQGKVVRIKKGVFRIAKLGEGEIRAKEEIENQIKLF